MSVQITAETEKGGAVRLNDEHNVWASYAVATSGDTPPAEHFYAGVGLPNGKTVQFFVNRETGAICVEVINKRGNGGVDLFRHTVN